MVAIEEGKSVEIGCTAHGHPTPTYTWYRNSELLSDQFWDNSFDRMSNFLPSRVRILPNSLFIEKVSPVDAGIYRCIVNNSLGSEIIETRLVVRSKHCFYFITFYCLEVTSYRRIHKCDFAFFNGIRLDGSNINRALMNKLAYGETVSGTSYSHFCMSFWV